MKVTFLGVGSAFATEHFQSNAVVEVDGKRLLIDAGGTVHLALKAANVSLATLDGIYVTHLHADHWGGAEYLAYASYFSPAFVDAGTRRRLKLFAHPSVRAGVWDSLKDRTVLPHKKAELCDYFDVQQHGDSFDWEGLTFSLIQTIHTLDHGVPMPCFGLSWQAPASGRKIWFSADAVFDPQQALFTSADTIFHDCETSPFKTGVHAHFSELVQLPEAVRQKITLYHFNDGQLPDSTGAGFAGWAVEGQQIEL